MLFRWHSTKEGFLLCPHPGSSDSSDRDENKVTLGQHLCGTLEGTESWPRWPGRRYHSVCNIWEPKLSCCGTQMGKSKNRLSCLQENTGALWYWGYLSRTLGEGVVPRHTLGKGDYEKEDVFYGQGGKYGLRSQKFGHEWVYIPLISWGRLTGVGYSQRTSLAWLNPEHRAGLWWSPL